jgi:DNA polymerase elongation subunit (family B)
MTGPKVLFYDIETSLQLVAVFQLGNNDWIDPSNLVTERYIICASWSWEGESKVHHVSVLDDPKRFEKDPYDDFHVVNALHKVLSEADVIVGHNSDSFDTPYVNTRALYHGLSALPPITSIDTYKVAKSKFRLNSNKLDYIGKFLKLGRRRRHPLVYGCGCLRGRRKPSVRWSLTTRGT